MLKKIEARDLWEVPIILSIKGEKALLQIKEENAIGMQYQWMKEALICCSTGSTACDVYLCMTLIAQLPHT